MDTVGDFQLERLLGEGAMGAVYVARSPRFARPVALKLLKPDADAQDVRRFQAEAKAVARLEHPHVVQVLEQSRGRCGRYYLALELVEGESLDARLERDGPLPPRAAAALAREMASAIACAHEAGVLHRDLKPHNVLLDQEGHARLTDFGLAKVLDAEALTRPGELIGTPVYMAPEQALAERERIGPQTDVYGLGATLYHLVTGRRPFEGKGLTELLVKIVREPPRAPREIRPEIPPELEAIVLRCLAKDPAQRFPSAAALEQALAAHVSGGGPRRGCLRSCPLWGGAAVLLLGASGLGWPARSPGAPAAPSSCQQNAPGPEPGGLGPYRSEGRARVAAARGRR